MKDKLIENKEKIKNKFNKFKIFSTTYAKTNIVFISYIVISLFDSTILRFFTTEEFCNIKPVPVDLAVILLIG